VPTHLERGSLQRLVHALAASLRAAAHKVAIANRLASPHRPAGAAAVHVAARAFGGDGSTVGEGGDGTGGGEAAEERGLGGEGGEEEDKVREIRGSWCSATVAEEGLDVHSKHLCEGVCISHIPASTTVALVIEAFLDMQQDGSGGSGGRDAAALRQHAHPADVLIAWASLLLFEGDGRGGVDEVLRMREGEHVLQMAAPPVDSSATLETVLSKQEQQATLSGAKGQLWSHHMSLVQGASALPSLLSRLDCYASLALPFAPAGPRHRTTHGLPNSLLVAVSALKLECSRAHAQATKS